MLQWLIIESTGEELKVFFSVISDVLATYNLALIA